jgi:hypothetical protein
VTDMLYESVQVKLDFNGNGTASQGPSRSGESWQVANTQIQCTGALPTNGEVSTWFSYFGPGPTIPSLDSSYSPQQDQSDTAVNLGPGQRVTYVWTNGPPLGVATVTVTGTKSFYGR